MNTLREAFELILTGDKEESRLAARQVRKLLYSSKTNESVYKDIKTLIAGAFAEYYQITETWRQENFIIALSVIYFLRDKNHSPDFLFSWFFQLLQHKNGYTRHAVVKMIGIELGPLTVHIRFPNDEIFSKKDIAPGKANEILFFLFTNLHNLSATLWLPKYKRFKYIDSLPASPYKSVQMILAEMEDLCGKGYLESLTKIY